MRRYTQLLAYQGRTALLIGKMTKRAVRAAANLTDPIEIPGDVWTCPALVESV